MSRIPHNEYSVRGRTRDAWTQHEIHLNLNCMKDSLHHQYPSYDEKCIGFDSWLHAFLTYVSAVEIHEMGHIMNMDTGCDDHSEGNVCAWCDETDSIFRWLLW